jgi:hypothetical protein
VNASELFSATRGFWPLEPTRYPAFALLRNKPDDEKTCCPLRKQRIYMLAPADDDVAFDPLEVIVTTVLHRNGTGGSELNLGRKCSGSDQQSDEASHSSSLKRATRCTLRLVAIYKAKSAPENCNDSCASQRRLIESAPRLC